jgi:drug/metabolite transporter (DMT)-like permease
MSREPAPTNTAIPTLEGVHERPLAGIVCVALGVSLIPLMDGFAKHLSGDFHVFQVAWGRFAFHIVWLLPFILWRLNPREIFARHPGLQLLRGVLLLAATLCYFSAIAWMPIADALALLFISPMICTALSPIVLGEHVGRWRWAAVATGFIGALVVIRPGLGMFQPAALLALGAGACHGGYLLATRRLAGRTNPTVTLLFTGLVGLAALSLAMPVVWRPPAATDWLLMALMGLFAASGHFLIIRGFNQAPASIVAPIGYFEIVVATIVGYVGFGDFPDSWTWAGITIIVASGIVITLREGRQRTAAAPLRSTH